MQLAAKTSSSKKRKISTRQAAKGDDDDSVSPDVPRPSCELDCDPSYSFTSTTPIPSAGARSPVYIRSDSQAPVSSLPPYLQTAASEDPSSAASSPTAAYADLSLRDASPAADPQPARAASQQDPRGSSPFTTKPSYHRAVMGGAADFPERASSPLKRRASSMDPEEGAGATAMEGSASEDVDMVEALTPADAAQAQPPTDASASKSEGHDEGDEKSPATAPDAASNDVVQGLSPHSPCSRYLCLTQRSSATASLHRGSHQVHPGAV